MDASVSSVNGMFLSGKYLYISNAYAGFTIIDISNPSNPTLVYNTSSGNFNFGNSIFVEGKYLYYGSLSGLSIVDISNPTSPNLIQTVYSTSTLTFPDALYVRGGYVYAIDQSSAKLVIISIADKNNPSIVGSIHTANMDYGIGLALSGKYVYYGARNSSKLVVIDVSDPSNPIEVGSKTVGSVTSVAMSGKYVFVQTNSPIGINVVDVSSSTNPVIVGSVYNSLMSSPYGVAIDGKYAYITGDSNAGTFSIINLLGADISSANIGNIATNELSVYENVNIGNSLSVHGGLNLGQGGLLSNGALAISVSSAVSTSTIFSAGTNTTSSILAVNADGTISINGAITSGTWHGNAISSVYGGTGQDSSAWSGVAIISGGVWSSASSLDVSLGGTGTTTFSNGGVLFSDGTKLTQNTSEFYWDSVNKRLGLGTNAPAAKLHINGGELLVDNPINPTLLGSVSVASVSSVGGIYISGKYGYVSGEGKFLVFDVSKKSSPVLISTLSSSLLNTNLNLGVKISGKYAYVLAGSLGSVELVAIDISNPYSPAVVGSITDSSFYPSFDVSGNYAFIGNASIVNATYNGLMVVDISNPLAMSVVTNYTENSHKLDSPTKIKVFGNYLYLYNGAVSGKFVVVDISNPLSPVVGGSLSLGATLTTNITVSGRYAYYVEGNGSVLKVVDVSNPSSPTVVGSVNDFSAFFGSTNLFISGNYLYTVGGSGNSWGLLTVVDISDPTNPTVKTSLNTGSIGQIKTLQVVGNNAYVAGKTTVAGEMGFSVININGADISSADIGNVATNDLTVWEDANVGNNLSIKNSLTVGAGGILSNGPFSLFTGNTSTANIFTIAATGTPNILSINGTGNIGIGAAASLQSKLYVYDGTLRVDSPVHPTSAGNYDTTGTVYAVDVSGRYAYVADGTSGLEIFDITTVSSPVLIGFYDTAGTVYDVKISGRYAYVADGTSGLEIFDITNPSSPTLVGSYDTAGASTGVYVSGKYAYVADETGSNGFLTIDVSDPSRPLLISTLTTTYAPVRVYVNGKNAYVATAGGGGLAIVNISDAKNPILTTTTNTGVNSSDVYVSGRFAYVASTGGKSVTAINISSPASPLNSFVMNTNGPAEGVYVSGKYAYITDTSTFYIFDISNSGSLIGSYPISGEGGPVKVIGKYAYVANGTAGFKIMDIKGADISSADIGNVSTNDLTIWENADIGNNLYVRNGLNVGTGGLLLNGDFAMSGMVTNTLSFSTTTIFKTSVTSSANNAFIFDAINTPSSSTKYLLSLRAGGTPVFSVSSNGNVNAVGTFKASSATVGTPGTPGDLAERVDISLDDSVEPGDVVVVDQNSIDTYRRSNGAYSETVAGVISTNPTIVVGDGKTENTALMAMVGRVPVKVSNENGPIKKGDLLVTASLPGYAMRYDNQKDEAVRTVSVVGLALEDMPDGTVGKIMGLVKTGWINNAASALTVVKNDLQKLANAQGISLQSNNNLNVQNVGGNLTYSGGDLNLQGNQLLNVASIYGKNNKWLIDEQGRFITRVSTSGGDRDMYAMQSPNSEFVFSSSSQMVSGEVKIVFDQYVQEVIDQQQPIKINITLTSGEGKGIYVSEKSAQGFTVKELDNGHSNATFDWIVVATRKPTDQTVSPEILNNIIDSQSGNSSPDLNSGSATTETVPAASSSSTGGITTSVLESAAPIVTPSEPVVESAPAQNPSLAPAPVLAPVSEAPAPLAAP
ncbi:MAG: hypothetical protein NT034_00395 [Candidatus Magasanikbacteria bacterium]|nr:hypothetical protein [Candidatus Magasanikbacteria bacterium]